jgi:hypothetical protein
MVTGKPGPVGRLRAAVGPDWLIKVVRPSPAPVPWAQMLRAALAVCGPLAAGLTLDKPLLGMLAAMGGLLVTVVDAAVGPPLQDAVDAVAVDHSGGLSR